MPRNSSLNIKMIWPVLLSQLIAGGLCVLFFGATGSAVFSIGITTVALLLYWAYHNFTLIKPLHNLLYQVRNLRHNRQKALIKVTKHDKTSEIAHEFNRIYVENRRLCNELAKLEKVLARKVSIRNESYMREIRQLKKTVNTESMTGLANRRYFDEYSQILFEHAIKHKSELACLLIDVDNFKYVNDNWGHAVGDNIIIFLGELLKAFTREGDLCVRYGGDEFVILLHKCDKVEAETIAERIRLHFGREVRCLIDGDTGKANNEPRLSIGIATVLEHHSDNVEHLMKMADKALYNAKRSGRNRVEVY